jgi:hypothetical protein
MQCLANSSSASAYGTHYRWHVLFRDCCVLPVCDAGDVVRTELRLALSFQGWEYTVLKKDSNQSISSSGGQEIQVMVGAKARGAIGRQVQQQWHGYTCLCSTG